MDNSVHLNSSVSAHESEQHLSFEVLNNTNQSIDKNLRSSIGSKDMKEIPVRDHSFDSEK